MFSILGLSALGGTNLHAAAAQKAFVKRLAPRSANTRASKEVIRSKPGGRDHVTFSKSIRQPAAATSPLHRCRQQQIVISNAGRSPVTDSYDSFDSLSYIEAPVDVETKLSLPQKARFSIKKISSLV
jgi:hypothetical protein